MKKFDLLGPRSLLCRKNLDVSSSDHSFVRNLEVIDVLAGLSLKRKENSHNEFGGRGKA